MRFLPALVPLCLGFAFTAAPAARPYAERVSPNDNRTPAGTQRAGILTVRLEVRLGEWRPDGDNDAGVEVLAFAEEGGALRIPGPLIRVTEGTEIRASVRNTLSDLPLVVRGLYTRGAAGGVQDTLRIAPGTTREVRFQAGAPGTYYYWASTSDANTPPFGRRGRNSQLSGALIVDPRGTRAVNDRVFVIGVWSDDLFQQIDDESRQVVRFVINGKSWPHTERFEHTVGDTVRWRVINTNSAVHPMHLHGFYFRVHSRGDERADTIFPRNASRLAVTERLAPGHTATISWVPERAGNWLFHCHDNIHIRTQLPFPGAAPAVSGKHVTNHSLEMMQGLVLGVQVRPRSGAAAAAEPATRRRLRLVARPDEGAAAGPLAYQFVLQEGTNTTQSPQPAAGPPIVLRRREPVSITVVNQLPEATAVHWHGIELDSYYDGVADFSGQAGRIAPAIAPRDSFVARFTPPRAGTFIYHTHVDETRQQRAGLAGALIVLEPGTQWQPQTDLVMLVSTPRATEDQEQVLLNGSTTPAPLELRAGTRYRIRIINIHTYRPSMRFELRQGNQLLTWRALAKDAADLPPERATTRPATQQMGNGETYDFEFVPTAAGEIQLNVVTGAGLPLVNMAVRVR